VDEGPVAVGEIPVELVGGRVWVGVVLLEFVSAALVEDDRIEDDDIEDERESKELELVSPRALELIPAEPGWDDAPGGECEEKWSLDV